jgi:hypothetical protein
MSDLVQIGERKPPRYSATSIKMFRGCQRKYYWEYVADPQRPAPPSKAQEIGTAVHAAVEKYLRGSELPDDAYGRIARPGLRHWPLRSPALRVEEQFSFPAWPGGPMITGTKDFWDSSHKRGWPLLGDHKTPATSATR